METALKLISYRVESLLITGATDPDAVGAVCRAAKVRHLNLDLPGTVAPSVISDNRLGAMMLTERILKQVQTSAGIASPQLYFVGGIGSDHSTSSRISGFRQALSGAGLEPTDEQINACGYAPDLAEAAMESLYQKLGRLPDGLIVNSTIAFEGFVRFLRRLPRQELHTLIAGCYDWDPFAALVEFSLTMVRQDSEKIVSTAFSILELLPNCWTGLRFV